MSLLSRNLIKVAASRLTRTSPIACLTIRNHMNHGGGDFLSAPPMKSSGPRAPCELGLDAARATQNILRLLESSTHGVIYSDTLDTIWHSDGLVWQYHAGDDDEWKAFTPTQAQQEQTTTLQSSPRLMWLSLSDDRTALAKIQGMNGLYSYVSMLRLDAPSNVNSLMVANDGWQILRQVNGTNNTNSPPNNNHDSMVSINDALQDYLCIEHGGGEEDAKQAKELFAPQASLLAVGTAPLDESPTDWSAPSGSLLEVSLDTYLDGVSSQTPHENESRKHDAIVQIDVLPCQMAAAATVHVGNGAQMTLFVDHSLLGYSRGDWKILSKTFTPRAWPE